MSSAGYFSKGDGWGGPGFQRTGEHSGGAPSLDTTARPCRELGTRSLAFNVCLGRTAAPSLHGPSSTAGIRLYNLHRKYCLWRTGTHPQQQTTMLFGHTCIPCSIPAEAPCWFVFHSADLLCFVPHIGIGSLLLQVPPPQLQKGYPYISHSATGRLRAAVQNMYFSKEEERLVRDLLKKMKSQADTHDKEAQAANDAERKRFEVRCTATRREQQIYAHICAQRHLLCDAYHAMHIGPWYEKSSSACQPLAPRRTYGCRPNNSGQGVSAGHGVQVQDELRGP